MGRVVTGAAAICVCLAELCCLSVRSASAQPISAVALPVTGRLSGGASAAGEVAGQTDGRGVFWVSLPRGVRCSGTWPLADASPTLTVAVRCGPRLRGEAVITRRAGFVSGSAILSLSDGRRGQFVFGDLRYDEVFGPGPVR